MSLPSIKQKLATAGLHLAIEKDATSGHEFTVTTADGQTIAYGWSGGTKTEAAEEAFRHPAVQLKLGKAVA
jgi:hypothetical protein